MSARLGVGVVLVWGMVGGTGAGAADMAPGERLFRLAGCENCHTDREHGGAALAGGRRLATPLGTFYTPNITPDRETGIGRWSEADLRRALREGVSPAGRHYYPSFPYTSYTRLSDADIHDLWAYLQTRKPVRQANHAHDLPWYLRYRPLIAVWKWLFFRPGAYVADATQTAEWNRGAYLVQGAAHCGECHTPRNALGGFRSNQFLAGVAKGPDGCLVPNITQDSQYGIGRWSGGDIVQYLGTGLQPDGDSAGNLMAEVIDNGLRYQTEADLKAMAIYLKTLAAVPNPVSKSRRTKSRSDTDY